MVQLLECSLPCLLCVYLSSSLTEHFCDISLVMLTTLRIPKLLKFITVHKVCKQVLLLELHQKILLLLAHPIAVCTAYQHVLCLLHIMDACFSQAGHAATDQGSSGVGQPDAEAGPCPGAGGERAGVRAGQEHHEQEAEGRQSAAGGGA